MVTLGFALYPTWGSLGFKGGAAAPRPTAGQDGVDQVVLDIQGMTCPACAATAREALLKVPGIAQVEVDYDRAEAIITAWPGATCSPEVLIQAARDAGFQTQLKRR